MRLVRHSRFGRGAGTLAYFYPGNSRRSLGCHFRWHVWLKLSSAPGLCACGVLRQKCTHTVRTREPCAQKIHAVCCTRLNILNLCPIPTSLYATLVCDSREHQARAFQERVGPQCKQSFNPSRTQGHVAEPLVCGFFCACVSILSLVLFILVLPNVGDGIAICFETLHFLKGQFAELFRCFPSRKKL